MKLIDVDKLMEFAYANRSFHTSNAIFELIDSGRFDIDTSKIKVFCEKCSGLGGIPPIAENCEFCKGKGYILGISVKER